MGKDIERWGLFARVVIAAHKIKFSGDINMLRRFVLAVLLDLILINSVVADAKEIYRDGRFIADDNGTVLDRQTNRMWASKDNGSNINWANAKSYCENYRGGGYSDWRMPTQDELAGLYNTGQSQKAECGSSPNHVATGLINLTCWCVWASETRSSEAAYFLLDTGNRYWSPKSYDNFFRALPVRSGK